MTTHFTFFESYYTAVQALDKETKADYYDAIFKFMFEGIEPLNASPMVTALFSLTKPTLENSLKKQNAGKRGGERKQTSSTSEAERKQTSSTSEAERKQTSSTSEAERKQTSSDKERERERERDKEKKINKKETFLNVLSQIKERKGPGHTAKLKYTQKAQDAYEALDKPDEVIIQTYVKHFEINKEFSRTIGNFLEDFADYEYEARQENKPRQPPTSNGKAPEEGSIDWILQQENNGEYVEVLDE